MRDISEDAENGGVVSRGSGWWEQALHIDKCQLLSAAGDTLLLGKQHPACRSCQSPPPPHTPTQVTVLRFEFSPCTSVCPPNKHSQLVNTLSPGQSSRATSSGCVGTSAAPAASAHARHWGCRWPQTPRRQHTPTGQALQQQRHRQGHTAQGGRQSVHTAVVVCVVL